MALSTGKLAKKLQALLARWQPSAEFLFLSTTLFVGLVTGAWAILFRYLISWISYTLFEWIPRHLAWAHDWHIIFAPAIGGLIVGLIIKYWSYEARGAGVPEVMESVALHKGIIRPRVILAKTLASSITIGSGGSAGREGPIVQIGSAIGSLVGQLLNLSENRIINLVACGAAGGIAAAFNTPIAGVIFALEVILGQFYVRYFSSVVIAAVTASVISRIAFGDAPSFAVPFEYRMNSNWEFVFYAMLAIAGAFIGVLFTRTIYKVEAGFSRLRMPGWIKTGIGGLLVGIIGYWYAGLHPDLQWGTVPHFFGVGYETLEMALASRLTLIAALSLLALKMLTTGLTIGSGGSGGIFAPSLFMGAMLGTLMQYLCNYFFPGLPAPPGAYALLGMAAVFSSISKAPMAALIMLFELTGDYQIILPLMLVVVLSTIVGQRLMKGESIYSIKLLKRGIRIKRGQDVDILENVSVAEVLTEDYQVITKNTPISYALKLLSRVHTRTLLILDEDNKLYGLVTLTDIENAIRRGLSRKTPVQKIATTWPHLLVTYPDEAIGDALPRMSARGIASMPVVHREDPYKLVGLLKRRNILKAYNVALSKRSDFKKRQAKIKEYHKDENEIVEIPLGPNDPVIGKSIKEIAKSLPKDCILVSIKRDGHLIMPHGDTIFQPGDIITALVAVKAADDLFSCLHKKL